MNGHDTGKAEEAALLTDSDPSFGALFQHHPIPMWIAAAGDGRILRVNEAAARSHGLSAAAFVGRHVDEIARPLAPLAARIPGLVCHLDAEGRERHVELVSRPVVYGGVAAFLAAIWDVTDRLRAEQALRDVQRLARIATWRLEPGPQGFRPSPELAAMMGFDPDAGPPDPEAIEARVHVDDRPALHAAFAAALAGRGALEAEFRVCHPDGRIRHLRAGGAMRLPMGGPSVTDAVLEGYCQDVTDSREAEDALRQAEKLSAMGQLTGGVAHDFNNLLTVVSVNLEMALGSVTEGPLREMLAAAAAAAARGAALTTQLLAFARQQPLVARPVELGPFVAAFAAMVSRSIGPLHPVVIDAVPESLWVQCDPSQLEATLLNLALNARDAMPEGGPITLVAAPEPGTDGLVAISVRDSGTGMAPEVAARALEPFFTTKPQGKGTGLGLSMALGFARQSGGDLRLETAPGCGTVLTLLLPAALPADVVNVSPPSPALPRGISVLVVEDDETVRAVAKNIFERFGATVVAVASAEEALAVFDGGAGFDLVFSDIVLGPGLDGFALGQRLRESDPRLPLLFTSGYNEGNPACGSIADCELLPKPYMISALREAVLRTLERRAVAKGW